MKRTSELGIVSVSANSARLRVLQHLGQSGDAAPVLM